VSTTTVIHVNAKVFETERVFIFCLKAIGLQYTLIQCILPQCSRCTQTDINSPNSFIAGEVDTGDKLIAGVVVTGDLDKK
jgi:hypothetical protein